MTERIAPNRSRPMNEPKKALLLAAAKKRWPKATFFINHRKHTIRVTFVIEAASHAELLKKIEAAP